MALSRAARGCGPRRGDDPGIVRVVLPATRARGSRPGFRATARTPRAILTRVFFDSEWGGADAARAAARAWRGQQLANAAVPDPPARRVVLKPKSTSGIVGVFRRPARRGSAAWVATYETSAGERRARSYSVGRYGEAGARRMAVDQRRAWEREDLGCVLPPMQAERMVGEGVA